MNDFVEDRFRQHDGTREFFNIKVIEMMYNELDADLAKVSERFNLEVTVIVRLLKKEILLYSIRNFDAVLAEKKNSVERRKEQLRLNGNQKLRSACLHC